MIMRLMVIRGSLSVHKRTDVTLVLTDPPAVSIELFLYAGNIFKRVLAAIRSVRAFAEGVYAGVVEPVRRSSIPSARRIPFILSGMLFRFRPHAR